MVGREQAVGGARTGPFGDRYDDSAALTLLARSPERVGRSEAAGDPDHLATRDELTPSCAGLTYGRSVAAQSSFD